MELDSAAAIDFGFVRHSSDILRLDPGEHYAIPTSFGSVELLHVRKYSGVSSMFKDEDGSTR